jgi:hypothetical protein
MLCDFFYIFLFTDEVLNIIMLSIIPISYKSNTNYDSLEKGSPHNRLLFVPWPLLGEGKKKKWELV